MYKNIHGCLCDILKQKHDGFPGCLPKALTKADIPGLFFQCNKRKEYTISHKADGYRYLWVVCYSGKKMVSVLLDRKMNTHQLDLPLPESCFDGTIFDLELVEMDGKKVLFIFDTLALMGKSLTTQHYGFRISCAIWFLDLLTNKHHAYESYAEKEEKNPHAYVRVPVQVRYIKPDSTVYLLRIKPIYYISAINNLPIPDFPVDGLIFQSTVNSIDNCFKWKPPDQITIDFKVLTPCSNISDIYSNMVDKFKVIDGNMGLFALENGMDHMLAYVRTDITKNNQIWECAWDFNKNEWLLKRERVDKSKPNSVHVVYHTIKVIEENVKLEQLGHLIQNHTK